MTACRCKNLQAVFIKRKKKQKRKTFHFVRRKVMLRITLPFFFSLRVQINLLDSIHLLIVLLLTVVDLTYASPIKQKFDIEKQWLKTDKRKQINSHTSNFHTTITPLQKYPLAKGVFAFGDYSYPQKANGGWKTYWQVCVCEF